jgi:hypothetical protein
MNDDVGPKKKKRKSRRLSAVFAVRALMMDTLPFTILLFDEFL